MLAQGSEGWRLKRRAHLQMAISVSSCAGVSRLRSLTAPKEVLGHLEPGFSRGRLGCIALTACFSWTSTGGNPLRRRGALWCQSRLWGATDPRCASACTSTAGNIPADRTCAVENHPLCCQGLLQTTLIYSAAASIMHEGLHHGSISLPSPSRLRQTRSLVDAWSRAPIPIIVYIKGLEVTLNNAVSRANSK